MRLIQNQCEKKSHYWINATDSGGTNADSDGLENQQITVTPFNQHIVAGLSQGSSLIPNSQFSRNGAKVRLTGLYIHGYLKMPAITDPTEDDRVGVIVRMIIYIKKQGVESMSPGVVGSVDLNMYTILYDKKFVLHSNGPGVRLITIKKKWKNGLVVEWTPATTGGSGTITKNDMIFTAFADTTSQGPFFTAQSRLWFTDM